jgi:hypothetical protein
MAFGKRKREKAQALVETGSRGIGQVLNVQDTGMTMNDNPRVRMTFRIEPIDGSAAFEAEKTSTVSRVQIPRAGDRYPVWYDAADHSSWAYATVDTDEGRDQIRQLFGPPAETVTGIGNPAAAVAPAPVATAPDPLERLKKLDELRAAGLVTEAEFAEKKAQLLAEL